MVRFSLHRAGYQAAWTPIGPGDCLAPHAGQRHPAGAPAQCRNADQRRRRRREGAQAPVRDAPVPGRDRAQPHRDGAPEQRAGSAHPRSHPRTGQRQRPPDEGDRGARESPGGSHAGAEDGGHRPSDRRHRPRLQQPAARGQHEPGADLALCQGREGQARGGPREKRRQAWRQAHQPAALVRAQPVAAAQAHPCERPAGGHEGPAGDFGGTRRSRWSWNCATSARPWSSIPASSRWPC